MGIRRKAREAALQLLYAWDLAKGEESLSFGQAVGPIGLPLSGMEEDVQERQEDLSGFCDHLVAGVLKHQPELDPLLEQTATHWRLSRMDAIDRNVLRLGAFEILYCPEIPQQVTLNETIELVKKFSTKESASFINGILDRIAKEHAKK